MPLPQPAGRFEDEPFWTGGAEGELRIMRCGDCRTWLHPPTPVCRHCRSSAVSPEAVSGRATVFTYTVNVQPWTSALEVPYVVATVALAEDPAVHLTTRLTNVAPDAVDVGLAVRVTFEQSGDVWLPLFEPDDA